MIQFLPQSALGFIRLILEKLKSSKLVILILLCALGQGLYVLLAGLLGILIDRVFVQNVWSTSFLLLFPLIWLLSTVFNSLGKFYTSSITQDVRKISKEILFRHSIYLPNTVYVGRDAGEVEHLIQELSFSSRYLFNESFPFFVRTVVTLLVSVVIVGFSSVELIYLFFAWIALYIPISYLSAKLSVRHVSASLLSAAEVSASTVEVIENHELIPAFGTENFEINRFNQFLDKEWHSFNKVQQKIDMSDFLQRILQVLLPLGIALFLIFSAKSAARTPGSIASLFSFTLILASQVGDFGRGLLAAMEMKERIRAALKKLACPSQLCTHSVEKGDIEPVNWDIRFENVSFSYGNNLNAISNLNLEIKENQKLGIIGYSGAGKTTLIKLLRGFYRPDSGKIYIGGNELDKIGQRCLTQNIAEVSQTIPLFHRTIRENVAYGCPEASEEEIWEALKRAQIADYVRKLPEGIDTVVGVRGQKLSGGEKARIGIARALIRKAKIVILDEATAAIDSEAELLIQKGLEELMVGRTLIAIAHRLSTLRKMDKIIVLDKGRLIAEGSHDDLIRHNSLYKHLWNAQVSF